MKIIYQPKGAALEYSPLACNLWTTCSHGCKYCYAPSALHKSRDDFFVAGLERKNILLDLEMDCVKMTGDPRPIFLCFTCDPYQPHDEIRGVTREALLILEHYQLKAQVLTKGGLRAARDFHILKRNNWKFGTTLTGANTAEWEPGAATVKDRIDAIQLAHSLGIYTWVSIEPVINPDEVLDNIEHLAHVVDFWKVGKLNHYSEIEKKIDWSKFLKEVQLLLKNRNHYIKTDLLAWGKNE
jgi:DNA repair photolyase